MTSASRSDEHAPGRRQPTIVPARLTPSVAWNAAGLGLLWLVYAAVRANRADAVTDAFSNADRLIAFQHRLGLPSEAVVQQIVLGHEWLVRAANTYYLTMHFPAMVLFLVWALFTRTAMPAIRIALIGSTMVGLLIHLTFPLAPPRLLDVGGFVDTAREIGPDPYSLGIAKAANELAAMPSMHVGWALLIAMAVVSLLDSRWRWVVVAHPTITAVVVVVTANHYWTDVAAGAALAAIGWWLAVRLRPPASTAETDTVAPCSGPVPPDAPVGTGRSTQP